MGVLCSPGCPTAIKRGGQSTRPRRAPRRAARKEENDRILEMLAEKLRPLLDEARLGSKAESDDFKLRRFDAHVSEATRKFTANLSIAMPRPSTQRLPDGVEGSIYRSRPSRTRGAGPVAASARWRHRGGASAGAIDTTLIEPNSGPRASRSRRGP